jgi:putative NADH-flavin reductase
MFMKVALIGASGFAGKEILKELLERGHSVTAIVRHPEKITAHEHVKAVKGDVKYGTAELAGLFAGHDAVISSVRFLDTNTQALVQAIKDAKVKRYLVVGGAGSLEVTPGVSLISTAPFPEAYKPEASAGAEFLKLLKTEKELDWTFLSPSAVFFPGPKTGIFRIGDDALLSNERGDSKISTPDYATAMVNELEKPEHSRKRFTVGY